jgi:dTDP-4-amino-4,6-dideoxygalactose transaminase
MTWKVTLADLDLDDKEDDAVISVLHSRWLTSGEVTRRF